MIHFWATRIGTGWTQLLIREGDERPIDIDVKLAALFAGVAGAVNAAGFQATGFFSANMTGNVSALSDHLGLGQLDMARFFVGLVIAFTLGAFSSGLLIEAGRRRGVRAIYAYSIAFEAVLLVAIGLADALASTPRTGALLMVGLSFVMGLQNAATTRISNARVRTTHVSGMATDIGLSLSSIASGSADREVARMRLKLHLSTIVAFLVGGVLGVVVYLQLHGLVFVAAALILAAIALPEIRRAARMM